MLQKYFNIFICFIFPPPLQLFLLFLLENLDALLYLIFFFLPQLFSYFAVFFMSTCEG